VDASRIAVVIPCYNDGRLVVSAVESVQEAEPVELVVVSDGTTDVGTLAALDKLEARGVRVLRQENAGLGPARMAGVGATAGEFVFPLDADDMLLPGALAQLADVLAASPGAGFAWGDFVVVGDDDRPVKHVETARTFDRWLITYKDPIPASILFRREALLEVGGWDLRVHEEWDVMLKFAASRWDGVKLAKPVYLKRVQYRRLSSAANDVRPEYYRLLRTRHAGLFARRRDLARSSDATFVERLTLPVIERLYSRKPTLPERLLREFRWYRRSHRGSSAAALVSFLRGR
jgi:glycosyltransferase involved in cell wall biosynthesis